LTGNYSVTEQQKPDNISNSFTYTKNLGETTAQHLLQNYCKFLYERHGSYEAVARIAHLDRRTVKKYIVE